MTKDFVSLDSTLNSISPYQKRQKIFQRNFTSIFCIESIRCVWEFDKITFNCLVNQRSSQTFAMTSISSLSSIIDFFNFFRDMNLFDPSLKQNDSNFRQFNEIANFLRNFEHCQHLYRYRKIDLLMYLFNCLNDSTFRWLQKQSHFESLHIFSTALTNVFFSRQQKREAKNRKRANRKVAKKIVENAKSTSKLQNIDIFDSTLLAFDEFEFDLYRETASFLQHFQRCQNQYRKSNLLNLLSKCFCDFASEWFNFQSKFTSLKRFNKILAKAFSFAEISSRRVSSNSSNLQLCTLVAISESTKNASDQQIVRVICKLCKQNFNFNKKLYEHIRSHEISKFVKNSHLSINAINLVCEIEKKSLVSQKSHESFTKSQNSIFEFAVTFETIILLKRSTFQSFALKIASKSTKKSATCRHCKQTFNFKKMFRQHKREQHAKKFVVNSHFSIDAVKSTCESMKISTINSSSSASLVVQSNTLFLFASFDIFNSNRFHQNLEKKRFNQIIIFIQHLQQCQHLCCESELLEWMKIILCDFVDIWFENQSNFIFLHDFDIALTKTFSTFSLENNAVNLVCAIEKKSIVMNSFASSELQASTATSKQKFESAMIFEMITSSKKLHLSSMTSEIVSESMKNKSTQWFTSLSRSKSSSRTFESKLQEISVQKASNICSSLSNNTVNSTSEIARKSAITCSSSSQKSSIFFATSRNLITDAITSLQFVSSNCSSFSIATFKITSKCMKSTSISSTESAEVAKIIENSLAEIRTQTVRIRIKLETERAILQLSTLESASKSMKRFSIQQIVCVRICKRCKQSFNFNNKLHEHIRKHHVRKSVKSFDFRVFASESTYKFIEKSTSICSSASFVSQKSSILSATSRSQKFWFSTIFEPIIASTRSDLQITTYKINSKSMKSAIVNCSLTFSSISSHTSIRKHRKSHIQKFYLIMNDLHRMFVEKSKSFDLQQHQNRCRSLQNSDFRQFGWSYSISSKKSYLTIENLSRMFNENLRKKNLLYSRKSLLENQMNVFSRNISSNQMRIASYFKSTANQKPSISRNSKSSKSKSLNQHMFAKSIRTVFNENLLEKSIKLSYEMLDVFCINLKSSVEIFSFIFIFLRLLSIFFFAFAFVSIISAARMNCINVYQQVISVIDRVNIGFVDTRRNWEATKNKLLEHPVTKHQKFEFSTLYTQNHVQNQEEISSRLLVCFAYLRMLKTSWMLFTKLTQRQQNLLCEMTKSWTLLSTIDQKTLHRIRYNLSSN